MKRIVRLRPQARSFDRPQRVDHQSGVASVIERARAQFPRIQMRSQDHELVGLLASAKFRDDIRRRNRTANLVRDRRGRPTPDVPKPRACQCARRLRAPRRSWEACQSRRPHALVWRYRMSCSRVAMNAIALALPFTAASMTGGGLHVLVEEVIPFLEHIGVNEQIAFRKYRRLS